MVRAILNEPTDEDIVKAANWAESKILDGRDDELKNVARVLLYLGYRLVTEEDLAKRRKANGDG